MTGAQVADLENIEQKTGKECARAERDHRQVQEDPQAESEAVIHIGLVQPLHQAQAGRVEAERQQADPGQNPKQELARSAAF